MSSGCTETPILVNGVANMLRAPTTPIVKTKHAPINTNAVRGRLGRLIIISAANTNTPRSMTIQTISGKLNAEDRMRFWRAFWAS